MVAEAQRQPLAAVAPARRARPRRWWPVVLTVVLLAVVARAFFVEPFRIVSVSMAPTLGDGDQVLVDKRAYRTALPRRGDLVVFRAPRTGDVMLKRAIGLPGDTVAIEDGILVVNERPRREPYADPDAIDSVYFGPVRVRAGSVFVLGDNRADSIDSRDFGAVARRDLVGRARVRLWPLGGWGEPTPGLQDLATD
ncbi:MAG: signal peptidase I [Solirubrobacteraceae bacterium]